MIRRLLPALVTGALIVLTSPWIGAVREWVRSAFPGRFLTIVNAGIALLAAAAAIAIVGRLHAAPRDAAAPSWSVARRYLALGAAALIAIAWTALNQHMSAETNAVERFHFLEYGVMTWLFYRAWHGHGPHDGSLIVLPVLAGVIVGTADEALQWFVPVRVGEVRDVFLNLAAIASGLLVSLASAPPRRFTRPMPAASRRRVAATGAIAVLALAAFIHAAHLGYRNVTDAGVFLSRYTASELAAVSAGRAARWRTAPPPSQARRFAREDQYLFEANRHVQARNAAWARDLHEALGENRVLETYYAAALDTPSYAVPAGSRWPDEQRRDAEQRSQAQSARPFVSRTLEGFVLVWPKSLFWAVVGVLVAGIVARARRPGP